MEFLLSYSHSLVDNECDANIPVDSIRIEEFRVVL